MTEYRTGGRHHAALVYAEPYGYRPLELDLWLPPAAASPAPLVIWLHGGAWRTGHRTGVPDPLAGTIETLLDAGFAVAGADYRLSAEAPYPAQLDDVKSATRWLREQSAAYGLDPRRFAVWGESAGGHLASLLALTGTGPETVQCAVAMYAPAELGGDAPPVGEPGSVNPEVELLGGEPAGLPEAARAGSPLAHVSAQAPPLRLVHGAADSVVPVSHSRRLAEALRAAGAPVEYEEVPGAEHCFFGIPHPEEIVARCVAFTRERLGAAA